MVSTTMSKESESLAEANSISGSLTGNLGYKNSVKTVDSPKLKRHVIKTKNLKLRTLDRTAENTVSSAKRRDFIQKFSRRHKPITKRKGELPICEESNIENKELQKPEKEPVATSDSEELRQSFSDELPANISSLDTSSPNAVKSKTLHEDQAEPEGKTALKKNSASRKSLKNDKMTQPRKRAVKVPVKSHVLTEYYPVRRSSRKTKSLIEKEQNDIIVQAIESQCEDGLSIVELKQKGRGVMAKRAFKKGSFVVEYAGELINWNEAREREQEYSKDSSVGCYMYYFVYNETNYCIDATAESGRLGRLLNHSRKNPNCKTKLVPMPGLDGKGTSPRLVIVAKRDITAGEELTYDYGDRDKETQKLHPWLKFT